MAFVHKFKDTLRVSKEVLRLIWQTSKGYTIYLVVLLAVSALIPILEAYLIKKVVDALTLSLQTQVAFEVIVLYLSLFVVVTLVNRVVETQRNSTQIIFGNLFIKEINQKIAEKTTKLAFWRFEDPKFHDKLDRTREQATWKPLNTFFGFFDGLLNAILLISILALIFTFSPLIALLLILFTIPSLFIQIKYGEKWFNLLYKETPESRRLNYYQYVLSGHYEMKDVKLLNLKDTLLAKYKALYNKLFAEQKKIILRRNIWEFLGYIFSDLVLVLFYFFLAWRTFLQQLSIGDFTFFSTLYLRAVNAGHGLVRDVSAVYENNLFINELVEFLNMDEEQLIAKKRIPKKVERIEFKDVWFKYPGTGKWILKGVSFEMSPKQNVALVGENGAGKTTLVKLLTRLYHPDKGQILLNGVPVEDFDLEKYRDLIGVAFQDFARFHFTVEDNIRFGDIGSNPSKKDVVAAAKKAHIHKKIMSLPSKYKTILGRWYHEGHEISYGEWQRVAIARALIKDCPVYILDEPTAALDAKAEYLVFNEFKKQVKGKMAMFISHRFSNVRLANKIVVLENGKIIQQGDHKQLIKENGRYKELYEFQARSYRD